MKRNLVVKKTKKNTMLKAISYTLLLVQVIGACCVDTTGTYIPYLMVALPFIWEIPFVYANRDILC